MLGVRHPIGFNRRYRADRSVAARTTSLASALIEATVTTPVSALLVTLSLLHLADGSVSNPNSFVSPCSDCATKIPSQRTLISPSSYAGVSLGNGVRRFSPTKITSGRLFGAQKYLL